MNVTYEKKNAMTFIGYHTEIRPEEGYQKCPEFWNKEYAVKYARLWQTMKPETPIEEAILANRIGMFAICADAETEGIFAGCNFWGWGGYAKPASDHIFWQKGDPYCGDPAQEEQGLNSIFAADSTTLAIIKNYADRL